MKKANRTKMEVTHTNSSKFTGEQTECNLGFFKHEADVPHKCIKDGATLKTALRRISADHLINATYHCVHCKAIYVAAYPQGEYNVITA